MLNQRTAGLMRRTYTLQNYLRNISKHEFTRYKSPRHSTQHPHPPNSSKPLQNIPIQPSICFLRFKHVFLHPRICYTLDHQLDLRNTLFDSRESPWFSGDPRRRPFHDLSPSVDQPPVIQNNIGQHPCHSKPPPVPFSPPSPLHTQP